MFISWRLTSIAKRMGENLNKSNAISYSWMERLGVSTDYPRYTQCGPHPNPGRLSMLKIDENDYKVYMKKTKKVAKERLTLRNNSGHSDYLLWHLPGHNDQEGTGEGKDRYTHERNPTKGLELKPYIYVKWVLTKYLKFDLQKPL